MQLSLFHHNARLSYQKTGNGKKVVLLFHGFGQHHRAFAALSETLEVHCTLYAFDLFFHGQSQWNEGEQPLSKMVWKEIMLQFMGKHQIENFSLLGFSMGGKFALATLESFAHRIEHVYLLAPDGIITSFWYSLATYPVLLRHFFKSMIHKPDRLFRITSLLHSLHLADKGLLRFVESQMNTQEKRERVYYSWVVFRHLQFNMKEVARHINENSIQLTMIVGRHDKIITATNMQRLLQFLPKHELVILETGHNGVIAGSIPIILTSVQESLASGK